MISRSFFAAASALLCVARMGFADTPPTAPAAHGLDLGAMDTSVKPCEDFFHFANGGWLVHAVVSSDYTYAGVDRDVTERNETILHALLNAAAADTQADPNSPTAKVGSFYCSAMDTRRIDAEGITPLASELNGIASVTDVPSLLTEIARLHRIGVDAAFGVGVEQDAKQSSVEIAGVGQGGQGLPERGFYDRTDKDSQTIRDAYVAHIAKMLTFLGETPEQSSADAVTVLGLETKLAAASKYPVDLRDPQANYHKMTLADLDALTPGCGLAALLYSRRGCPIREASMSASRRSSRGWVACSQIPRWPTGRPIYAGD